MNARRADQCASTLEVGPLVFECELARHHAGPHLERTRVSWELGNTPQYPAGVGPESERLEGVAP